MKDPDDTARHAQATLDALRHEAGGALTGPELLARQGKNPRDFSDDPPLDWRLTPRNILLQGAALIVFLLVVRFLVLLVWDSLQTVFA